jgi:hypothetical protein
MKATLSDKEREHVRRLSIESRRLSHRLKNEGAQTISRRAANRSITFANDGLRRFFIELVSPLSKKLTGLSGRGAASICRSALDETLGRFCNWVKAAE